MPLDVERLTEPEQLVSLSPALADLQNAQLAAAPHCRPITADELARCAQADSRFEERAILVARRGGTCVGWCHLEPPTVARTAGDLYPYVGGESAFQPGMPFTEAGPDGSEVVRALLYGACQIRAQQARPHLELFAHEQAGCERELRAEGLQPADDWATYVAPASARALGPAPIAVSTIRQDELAEFAARVRELGVLDGELTDDDFSQLVGRFPGFRSDGLLLARRPDEIIAYAAVTIDPEYASATGRDRAWLGLGPLGLGVRPGAEQAEWLRALVNAASIRASAQGATEVALVANLEGREQAFWGGLGFEVEVRWRRWRVDL